MSSLSEVYEPDAEFQTSLRRLYAGVGLFCLGAVLVVAGILAATTHLFVGPDGSLWEMRQLGGTLAGLGVPAVFTGILTVLPADRRTRGAAVIGAAIAVLGVALFVHAYPCQWSGSNCGAGLPNLTLLVTVTYFIGAMTTFWCLFVGVANFKARNSPGGTARVEVTAQGETRVIEVPRSELQKFSSSLGVLGGTPEPQAETQTNRSDSGTSSGGGSRGSSRGGATITGSGAGTGAGAGAGTDTASDGGATERQIHEVADEGAVVERTASPASPNSGPSPKSAPSTGDETDTARDPAEDEGVAVFRSGSSSASTGSAGRSDATKTGTSTAGSTEGSASSKRSATRDGDWTPSGQPTAGSRGSGGADRDRYCGSCAHFRYVRTEQGMQPYCGADGEVMDDMDACDRWTSRSDT